MTKYRTKDAPIDYRLEPKSDVYCALCFRPLKPETKRRWYAYELDVQELAIHPDDLDQAWPEVRARRHPMHRDTCIEFEQVGPECYKKLGVEWTMAERPSIPK